ncbi:MAG: N-acetylmuramoyl-L-alanine amidase [Lachnospiraceae bacterium]|nr:N-acetylmuramoyl-L-alanine amidase [Lachnospiraceae bacterium]
MEEKVSTFLSCASMVLMGLCLIVLTRFPNIHEASLALSERIDQEGGMSVLFMLRDESQLLDMGEEYAELKEHQIRMEIPTSVDPDEIKIDKAYMTKEIMLSIPGVTDTYFYDYPMIGSTDGISDMYYEVHDRVGVIDISMNHVYEPVLTVSGNYLFLDFKRPKKVYDYLVAIDAGHGSRDPGCVQGDVYEKDINLGIVKQLKKLFDRDKHNIGVYYTRLEDSNPDFADRVGLANDIKADAFVSVHINSTDSGRLSGIRGTCVMYLVSDKTKRSKRLAENCLGNMLRTLGSEDRGLVPGDKIYIIRTSKAPVALCEVGFLTNPQEQAMMVTKEYQRNAARGIYRGILQTLDIQ